MNLAQTVKSGVDMVKTHWKTPAEGKYVPYREYKDIFLGVGSNYTGTKMLEGIGFWAACYLFMYHYQLPYLTFSFIGIINMPLNGAFFSGGKLDLLYKCAKKYEELTKYNYTLTINSGLDIDIIFKPVS